MWKVKGQVWTGWGMEWIGKEIIIGFNWSLNSNGLMKKLSRKSEAWTTAVQNFHTEASRGFGMPPTLLKLTFEISSKRLAQISSETSLSFFTRAVLRFTLESSFLSSSSPYRWWVGRRGECWWDHFKKPKPEKLGQLYTSLCILLICDTYLVWEVSGLPSSGHALL